MKEEEVRALLRGDMNWMTLWPKERPLTLELYAGMRGGGLRPKTIVDYEREPYIYEAGNVRITFDMKISASYELENFLDGDYQSYYILPSGLNVLEVKFDEILPSYIRNIVESYGFKQTSFSKYYYGRKIIDSYMR